MNKSSTTLLLIMLLLLSTTLITIPIARCEGEDPIHIYYMGNKISEPNGPKVWEGPCSSTSFTITVKVQWDSKPAPNKHVDWVQVQMVEISSFGMTFVPLGTTLYNPGPPDSIFVDVTVPVAGLPAGTYYANIKACVTAQGPEQTPTVAGTNGYFYFVKTVCAPPTAKVTFGQVGVESDFTGTILTVDSVNYGYGDLPKDFDWNIGSTHSFEYYEELVVDVGKKYVWTSTSGLSTDRLGSITVPTGGGSVTGWYNTKYYLTVQTDPSGLVTIPGEGWYEYCTSVDLTAPNIVPVSTGVQYRFDHWDVDGTTVSGNPITVHMDTAHTATADYVKQYYLTVQIDPSGLTPAPTPASDWYDENTPVTETAGTVTGYIFVNWDVDGTAVSGNPIDVDMDAPHTATAHYWLELGFETFVTDSSFNVIDHFDTVFTPKDLRKTMFKLASTNPGQFYLNIKITNTWAVNTGPITVTFTLDDDFIVHPIQGDPIQVWTGYGITGTRIPATVTYTAPTGTVTISDIAPGQTVYITIHMEYGPAREYFTKAEMQNWKTAHEPNIFTAGYTVTVPGPFPFIYTSPVSSVNLPDPVVVLGLED